MPKNKEKRSDKDILLGDIILAVQDLMNDLPKTIMKDDKAGGALISAEILARLAFIQGFIEGRMDKVIRKNDQGDTKCQSKK